MTTNAQLIATWRIKNPGKTITAQVLRDLGINLTVGADLQRADLREADLQRADLTGANLTGADLAGANLAMSTLSLADLSRINLYGATLYGANLYGANLYGADLYGADLAGAALAGANLSRADLYGSNLAGADLAGANLVGAGWEGLHVSGLPSGEAILFPTPNGWVFHIGCWSGTPDKLRDLISNDDGWPEAKGKEVARRRPLLTGLLVLVDAHMADRSHLVAELAERWKD